MAAAQRPEAADVSTAVVAARPSLGLLKPIAPPAQIIAQQNEMRSFIKSVLEEGRDYGLIPGVDKPSLLQPGAQRINVGFGVIPHFTTIEAHADHDRVVTWSKRRKVFHNRQWTGDWSIESGESIGVYRYVVRCELVHRDTGIVVGESLGACSTLESKYIDRPRDSENTCLKMAQKRAFVGATLTAYGLSDEFTQDVEDTGVGGAVADDPQGPQKVAPPVCPVHNTPMRDDRASKKNPKAPDWKCSKKNADGSWCSEVKWPGQWPPAEASATPERKRPEDMKIGGKRLGEFSAEELTRKLETAKAANDPKHQPLIDAIEAVLENLHNDADTLAPSLANHSDDLPF